MKRNYQRDYEFQKKINAKQAEEIEILKTQVNTLTSLCEKKDEIINSVDYLRNELTGNVNAIKEKRKEYDELIKELRNMKKVMNEEFFKGKWKIIKFLIK